MRENLPHNNLVIQRRILLYVLLSGIIALPVIWKFYSPAFAIRGLYGYIGVGIAFVVWNEGIAENPKESTYKLYKLFGIISLWIIISSILIGRKPVIFILFPAAFLLLILQARTVNSKYVVFQGGILLCLYGISKYITTDFYFGLGDSFGHISYIAHWVYNQSALTGVYSDYPGYHLIAASFSLISNVSPYDAAFLTVVLANFILIPSTYLLSRELGVPEIQSVLASLSMLILSQQLYSVTFMHPQSLAVVLTLIITLLLFRAKGRVTHSIGLVLVTAGLIITHHLTPMLLISGLVFWWAIARYVVESKTNVPFQYILLVITGAFSYWVYVGQGFFTTGLYVWKKIVNDSVFSLASSDQVGTSIITFGVTPRTRTPLDALVWLISFEGVYFILLITISSIGIVNYIYDKGRGVDKALIFLTGIGFFAILPVPASFKLTGRFSMVFAFSMAILLGKGLIAFLHYFNSDNRRVILFTSILLIAIGASVSPGASMTPADDLDSNFKPSMTERLVSIDGNHAFSKGEVERSQQTSQFIKPYTSNTSTLWTQKALLNYLGASVSTVRVNNDNISSGSGFLYRESWGDKQKVVSRRTAELQFVVFSPKCIVNMENRENKVYTVGNQGILKPAGGEGNSLDDCPNLVK